MAPPTPRDLPAHYISTGAMPGCRHCRSRSMSSAEPGSAPGGALPFIRWGGRRSPMPPSRPTRLTPAAADGASASSFRGPIARGLRGDPQPIRPRDRRDADPARPGGCADSVNLARQARPADAGQAPMSGIAPPELAAAVCNAGALGSIGCAALSSTMVREQVTTLRQATNPPFNLNFFIHAQPRIGPQAAERVRAKLAPYFEEFGLGAVPEPKELFPTSDEERLHLVLELRPPVVSFHFGLPGAAAIRQIKEAGCIILSSATTVAEARLLEANGADAIIAQGFEAGEHRGSFSGSPGAAMVGTVALVPKS